LCTGDGSQGSTTRTLQQIMLIPIGDFEAPDPVKYM